MTFPDFFTWAQNIILKARQYGTAEMEVEQGLQESFNQGDVFGYRRGFEEGRMLGHREGYTEGKDNAWWKEQEEERLSRVVIGPKETEH